MALEDRDIVIIGTVRTPFGRRGGALKDVHPVNLGAFVIEQVLERAGVAPDHVDQVIFGCVSQTAEQSANIARNAMLTAGLPVEIPATTLDFQCGSSQQAVHLAATAIRAGVSDVVIAGGVESMSQVPLGSTWAERSPNPPELLARYPMTHQGLSAQMVADKYGVSRAEMDEFGVRSHTLAAAARASGVFAEEIAPIVVGSNGTSETVTADDGIRPNASIETTSALAPVFHPDHSITAGNSSQLTDGAAAVLVMSAKKARELGLVPRGKIAEHVIVGCDPVLMLEGPIPATRVILEQSGLDLSEIDLFEVNEAFASVPLAWSKETGASLERTNVNGGAIALGHPVGATGARLVGTILAELERRDARYGLVTMCCGGGLGTATIIDRNIT